MQLDMRSIIATNNSSQLITNKFGLHFILQVYNDIAQGLEDNDYDDGSYGPVLLRLSWHAAGTKMKSKRRYI